MQEVNNKKLKNYSATQIVVVRLSSIFICITLLLFIALTHTVSAKAAMRPNALPPDPCLRMTVSVRNVHNVPISVGVGTAYNIVANVLNNCSPHTVMGIVVNVAGNLNCAGVTMLGLSERVTISSLSSGQSQTVFNLSRVAVCYTYDSAGNIIEANPPTQETFFGSAEGTFSINGGPPINATGSTTASLF